MPNNTSSLNSKLAEHFNEMLSAENAGIDYLQTRIDQIPLQPAKQRMRQHLGEARAHQDRLRQLISRLGWEPTESKADLPIENAEVVAYNMLI
jgi:ferritin-like metal-binding protein YciE